MKNTEKNREALNAMVAACEGTRYQIRIGQCGHDEDATIYPCIFTLHNAPKYTPNIYMDVFGDALREDSLVIWVQTTGYGALPSSEIMQVAEGLLDATNLVNRLALIAASYGIRVKF